MNRSRANCLKSFILFLHFLCWLCGAFVVAFGEFQMMNSKFRSLVTSFWPIFPANTLVVTGTLVTCVCFLGILGGFKENRCMIIAFFLLLFVLMLMELAMACIFLVYSSKIHSYYEDELMRSLVSYRDGTPEATKKLIDDFDTVQHLFQCCGVHEAGDWGDNIPISCCTTDPCNAVNYTIWDEGCMLKLRDWFSHNYRSTGAGVVTMFILQFICLCISLTLFCHLSLQGLGFQ